MPLDIEGIRAARPANKLYYLRSVDSTMNEAARLAAEGAPHGTVIIADEQTAGIGRMGRSWTSPPEAGIYTSVLLRLPIDQNRLPAVTLMLGLAAREAIQSTTHLICDLRWPNDVLIGGRKAAGIIAHLLNDGVVAGIGINLSQTEFPDGLRTPATSLLLEGKGLAPDRETVIIALLDALDHFAELLLLHGSEAILRAFTAASSYAVGRRVILEETGQHGTTAGLDPGGFLMIRFDSGELQRIAAGGVRAEQM